MASRVSEIDVDALFAGARAELQLEADAPWPCVVELHRRGTREIFERAVALCAEEVDEDRWLGVEILRELGGPPPRFAAEATLVLLRMLRAEVTPSITARIVSALKYQHSIGHRGQRLEPTPEVRDAVIGLVAHADTRVRFHVAAALSALVDSIEPEDDAVRALLALAEDPDEDVRYYALAGLIDDLMLGGESGVRAALEARLADPDPQIARAARRVLDGGEWGE